MPSSSGWLFWALLSACFAALTAIFAKIGIRGVDSDLATLVRTCIIVLVLAPFVWLAGKWSNPLAMPPRTLAFLALSALATGASWVCYFRALQLGQASQVAPVDKLSVALAIILSAIFLKEALTLKLLIGAGLIIAGTFVLIA